MFIPNSCPKIYVVVICHSVVLTFGLICSQFFAQSKENLHICIRYKSSKSSFLTRSLFSLTWTSVKKLFIKTFQIFLQPCRLDIPQNEDLLPRRAQHTHAASWHHFLDSELHPFPRIRRYIQVWCSNFFFIEFVKKMYCTQEIKFHLFLSRQNDKIPFSKPKKHILVRWLRFVLVQSHQLPPNALDSCFVSGPNWWFSNSKKSVGFCLKRF